MTFLFCLHVRSVPHCNTLLSWISKPVLSHVLWVRDTFLHVLGAESFKDAIRFENQTYNPPGFHRDGFSKVPVIHMSSLLNIPCTQFLE